MFSAMQDRVRTRKAYQSFTINFTRNDFYDFVDKTKFDELRLNWIKSNYDHKLAPSLDRVDNSKGYSLDNIQIITASENSKKERRKGFKRYGRTVWRSRPIKVSEDGVNWIKFNSCTEATNTLGIPRGTLSTILRGSYKHKKYIIEYEN